jgi:phosphomannomutase
MDELIETARRWIADDPDPATRQELAELLDRSVDGLDAAAARAELADRFAGTLEFGTAGLRGEMGAGPNRMNRAVVIRAAAGLAQWIRDNDGGGVVVGFDARRSSDVFARDTCAVMEAVGVEAMVLPRPLPTPVLAFALRHLGADAGVMVTASHNPPLDNGYKVYLGDGSQIAQPADTEIAERGIPRPGVVTA